MTLTLTLKTSINITETLFQLEGYPRTIVDIHQLHPHHFFLARLSPSGYVIWTQDEIVEYDLWTNLIIEKEADLFFFGPLRLYTQVDSEFHEVPKEETKPLNELEPKLHWTGIDSKRFYAYRNWVNDGNYCGMFTAAVLLAYYKDYIDTNIVPDSLHPYRSDEGKKLIMAMKVYIKSLSFRGTIASDVAWGINRYLRDYKIKHKTGYHIKAKGSFVSTFGIVKTRLDSEIPKPVIVGLYSWLGSPRNYRNHWVVAYSYSEVDDQRYYRVHDNHGRHRAVINVKWTVGSIRMIRHLDE